MENILPIVYELLKEAISVLESDETIRQRTPIEDLNISNRAQNALRRGGICYVEQLIKLDHYDILRLRNMGQGSFNEINAAVKKLGLRGWEN